MRADNRYSSASPAASLVIKQISPAQLMQRSLPVFFFSCLLFTSQLLDKRTVRIIHFFKSSLAELVLHASCIILVLNSEVFEDIKSPFASNCSPQDSSVTCSEIMHFYPLLAKLKFLNAVETKVCFCC